MENRDTLTEQEGFWIGDFGDQYIERNRMGGGRMGGRLNLFTTIIKRTSRIRNIIEFGSNVGLNLSALHLLLPNATLAAVEINEKAVQELRSISYVKDIYHQSILSYNPEKTYDFVFTSGLLIHIQPEKLPEAYRTLYRSSCKYITMAEYYNPKPVEIEYRGNKGKLFKRDFAGEFIDIYTDCRLIDYGFVYHRDPVFPLDDINWFLIQKN